MSKSMVIIDTPCSCIECYFLSKLEEAPAGDGLYRKIAKCNLANLKEVYNPWHDARWFVDNKESWCPLMSFESIDLGSDNAYEVRLTKSNDESSLTVTSSEEIAKLITNTIRDVGDRADTYTYNDVDVTVIFDKKKG